MTSTTWVRSVGVAALVLGSVACGDDSSQPVVPTAQDLAARLVSVDDFAGDWTISAPPDDTDAAASGVVTDEQRHLLPSFELCDAADNESRDASEGLRWMAFRQLELAVDDPIEPPDDRTGHMVFVQEYLMSADAGEIETTYDLLRGGIEACLGPIPAGEEGPGTAETMTLPDVGDERYGVLTTVEEVGGWAEWRLHGALVRDGAVLASIVVTDIRAGDDTEPLFTIDEVGRMVSIAVDRL